MQIGKMVASGHIHETVKDVPSPELSLQFKKQSQWKNYSHTKQLLLSIATVDDFLAQITLCHSAQCRMLSSILEL